MESGIYQAPTDDIYFEVKDGKTYYGCFCYVGGSSLWRENLKANIFNSYEELKRWYNQLSFKLNDCPDPYLVWGASSKDVTNYMESQGLSMLKDGINTNNNTYWTYFKNNKGTVSYEYRFDIDKTNLQNLLMAFSPEKYSKNDIMSKLEEKYVYRGYDQGLGGDLYYAKDFSTILLLYEKNEKYYVLYVGNSSSSKAKSRNEWNLIMNNLKSQMMSFR